MSLHTTLGDTSTLAALLDDELGFSPSFRGIYSNHLAMALTALHQLGASPAVLQATFDAHARNESEARDDTATLRQRLREVDTSGVVETVRTRVPALTDGPGTALFHPVIRLGYALEVGHPGQVAAALLDWERRLHVLPVPTPTSGGRRLAEVAADLAAHPSHTWPETYDLDAVARRPELSAALAGAQLRHDVVDDLSWFALVAHVSADAFITLHLMTGARALRTVSELVDGNTARALAGRALVDMAVAYAAAGAAPLLDEAELDRRRRLPLPSQDAIAERAIASPDPHVIKLANTALVEEERTGDPLYRYVAARVVDLVS